MSSNSSRIEKLEPLLAEQIALAIRDEIDLEVDIFATVSRVAISRTLEHATAWISVIPKNRQNQVIKLLQKDIHKIQSYVNDHFKTYKIPKITIKLDTSEEYAAKIEKLMSEVPPEDIEIPNPHRWHPAPAPF